MSMMSGGVNSKDVGEWRIECVLPSSLTDIPCTTASS